MKKISRSLVVVLVAFVLIGLCSCSKKADDEIPTESPDVSVQPTLQVPVSPPSTDTPSPEQPTEVPPSEPVFISGKAIFSFDFVKQSGSASNQYAVWIEDLTGKHIKTLYATRWAAEDGYKTRPDAIAMWVQRARRESMSDAEVDAVSGATPATGPQSYTWDLTDMAGQPVPAGEYIFIIEGTLRWKNAVVYSGVLEISDTAGTFIADSGHIYQESEDYAALTEDSPENNMIGPVTVTFTPS